MNRRYEALGLITKMFRVFWIENCSRAASQIPVAWAEDKESTGIWHGHSFFLEMQFRHWAWPRTHRHLRLLLIFLSWNEQFCTLLLSSTSYDPKVSLPSLDWTTTRHFSSCFIRTCMELVSQLALLCPGDGHFVQFLSENLRDVTFLNSGERSIKRQKTKSKLLEQVPLKQSFRHSEDQCLTCKKGM